MRPKYCNAAPNINGKIIAPPGIPSLYASGDTPSTKPKVISRFELSSASQWGPMAACITLAEVQKCAIAAAITVTEATRRYCIKATNRTSAP